MNLMKSSILQNSNWKIWRISALVSKTRPNNILISIYSFRYESAFTFLINIFKFFSCYFGLIDDLINSFRLNLTFIYFGNFSLKVVVWACCIGRDALGFIWDLFGFIVMRLFIHRKALHRKWRSPWLRLGIQNTISFLYLLLPGILVL